MTSPSLNDTTRLAIDRTRLAFERTMMAWVRTSAAMITFGFTIYKFFQLEAPAETAARTASWAIGSREFALLLIGVGLVSLGLAAVQHQRSLRGLRRDYPEASIPASEAGWLAALMSLVGIAAMLAVIFQR